MNIISLIIAAINWILLDEGLPWDMGPADSGGELIWFIIIVVAVVAFAVGAAYSILLVGGFVLGNLLLAVYWIYTKIRKAIDPDYKPSSLDAQAPIENSDT